MNYWENEDWFKKRNQEITDDRANRMTTKELMAKYHLTATRIFKIIQTLKKANKFKGVSK